MAGRAQGLTPTLTPFSVDYDPAPAPGQEIVAALAGPVWLSRRVPPRPLEGLAVGRLSRAGLVVTAVAALAMITLAAAGGIRLG